jgi:hypothetical protein
MRVSRWFLVFSVGVVTVAAGCKKDGPPEAASAAPEATISAAPTGPADATAEPAGAEAKADEPATPEAKEPEAAGEEAAKADPAAPVLEGDDAEVDALLRKFFGHLASKELDKARSLLMDEAVCKDIWTDPEVCGKVGEGQEEGFATFVEDPVPFNSKLTNLYIGSRQEIGTDKGVKAPTGIWVGSVIIGRGPDGNEFAIKSLGVIKTPSGFKVIWGKRRSGPDTPRNAPPPMAAPPTDPGAVAPATAPAAAAAPPAAALPAPSAAPAVAPAAAPAKTDP